MFVSIPRRSESRFAGGSRTLTACALLCLALLVLVSFVQVAHIHSTATDQDHCPLCIVLHSAVPIAAAAAVLILTHIAERTPVLETRAVSLLWRAQRFTRPPPFVR